MERRAIWVLPLLDAIETKLHNAAVCGRFRRIAANQPVPPSSRSSPAGKAMNSGIRIAQTRRMRVRRSSFPLRRHEVGIWLRHSPDRQNEGSRCPLSPRQSYQAHELATVPYTNRNLANPVLPRRRPGDG